MKGPIAMKVFAVILIIAVLVHFGLFITGKTSMGIFWLGLGIFYAIVMLFFKRK